MARNSRTTVARSSGYSTKWLRNAMKSVGISTNEVLKEMAPNMYEAASAGASTSKRIISSMSRNRGTVNKITGQLRTNKYVQFAQTAYKNAMSDIKSGNFNNQERMEKAMFDSIDGIEEFADGLSFGDDGADNVNVNVINSGSNAGFASLSEQMMKQTETSLKVQKANMDAFIAVNAASMQQMGQIGAEVIGHLSSINSNLAALVQYNNDNMNRFIEASIAYYDRAGAKLDDRNSGSGNAKLSAADVFNNRRGGLNFSRYKDYVKQQIKDTAGNSTAGLVASMLDDQMLSMAAANPLGFLTTGLVKYMVPKTLATTIETVETQFSNAIPNLLSEIADWTEDYTVGLKGTLKRAIGKTFGLKTERVKNLGNGVKIERGAIPFDGETKHAITEVITKELRDQTAYLEIIANHFKPNAKQTARANGEYWDWSKNKYVTGKEVDNTIANTIVESITNAFNSTAFGKSMNKLIDAQQNDNARNEMEFTIQELFTQIERQNKHLSLSDLINLVNATGASKSTKKIIRDYVKQMASNDTASFGNLNTARIQSQNEANNTKNMIMSEADAYHLISSSFGGDADVDTLVDQIMGFGGNGKNRKARGMKGSRIEARQNSGNLFKNLARTTGGHLSGIARGVYSGSSATSVLSSVGEMISDQVSIVMDKLNNAKSGGFVDQVKTTFKEIGNNISDGFMSTLFGKTRGEDGTYKKDESNGPGIVTSALKTLKSGLDGWIDALFGLDGTEEGRKKTKEDVTKFMKDAAPDAAAGGLIGAGIGALSGGSFLGMLVGGPLAGAAMGTATSFLAKSKSFQNWLFGEKDENGERMGGFISKSTQKFFKDNKRDLQAGAVIGTGVGAITGAGALGTIVGGPIAGALLGTASTIVLKSKAFNTFLFGDEKKGQKGIFEAVRDAFNAHNRKGQGGEKMSDAGKTLGMGIVGAGTGALTTALLGKLGIIGAALTPMGPVGGALLGLGLSIKAQSGNFKQWLFGEKDGLDINGKKAKKQGVLGQFANMLNANLLRPLKTQMTYFAKDAMITLQHDVLMPFSYAAEIVAGKAGDIATAVRDSVSGVFSSIGDGLKSAFTNAMEPAISGFQTAMSGAASLAYKTIKNMITLPGNMIKLGIETLKLKSKVQNSFIGRVASGILDTIKDTRSLIFSGVGSLFKIAMRGVGGLVKWVTSPVRFLGGFVADRVNSLHDKVTTKMREKGIEIIGSKSDSLFDRFNRNKLDAKQKRADLKAEVNELKRHDRNAKFIAKYTNNQYSEDTDEAREYLKMVRPDKYLDLIEGRSEGRGWRGGENTSKTQEADAARIAKEGRSTAGMSSEQLAKADVDQLNEEARQTYFLQGIFNMMRGKNWDGTEIKEGQSGIETGHERAIRAAEEEEKRKEQAAKEGNAEVEGSDSGSSKKKEGLDPGSKFLDGTAKGYINATKARLSAYFNGYTSEDGRTITDGLFTRIKKGLSDDTSDLRKTVQNLNTPRNISSLFSSIRHRANGGEIHGDGPVVVGENGPEIVELSDGDSVLSNRKTEKYFEREKKEREAEKKANEAKLEEARKRGKTKDEVEEEKEKEAKKEQDAKMLKVTEQNAEDTKEHKKNWLEIFGKKGLITGGLIAAFLFLKAKFPELINGIQDLATKVGSFLGDVGTNIVTSIFNTSTKRQRTNGRTAAEEAAQQAENIANGNIVFDENGNATHQSSSVVKFGARTALNIANSAYHMPFESKATKYTKNVANGVKAVGSGIKKGTSFVFDKLGDRALTKAVNGADDAAKLLTKAETFYDIAENGIGSQAKKMASGAVTKVKTKAKDSKLLSTVCDYVTKFFDTIVEKFNKKTGGKITTSIFSKFKPSQVIDVVKKKWDDIATKIAEFFGVKGGAAAVTAGLSEVAFATLGAIDGVSGTAKLFHVDSKDVDGKMRLIAGIFGALTSTTIGGIIDIVAQLIYTITGTDILSETASALYKAMSSEEDDIKLENAQTAFDNAYMEYQASEIEQQYETQKKAGIVGADITLDQFREGVANGQYNVQYKSFMDYNAEKNASFSDKAVAGLGKAWKGVKNGFGKVFGKKTKTYEDANGNIYKDNGNGGYDVFDAEGNSLGSIAKEALPEGAVATTKKEGRVFSKLAGGVKTAFKSVGGAASSLFKGIGEAGSAIISGSKNIIDSFKETKTDIAGYFKSDVNPLKEDNPLHGLVGGLLNIEKAVLYPKLLLGSALKSVGSAIGGFIKNIAKTPGAFVSGTKKIVDNFNNPDYDFSAYLKADVNTLEEDNPFHGVVSGLLNMEKVYLFPKLLLVGCFKKIGKAIGGFVEKIAGGAKAIGSGITTSVSDMWGLAKAGDTDGLSAYSPAINSDDPISSVSSIVTTFFTKSAFQGIGSLVKFGHAAKDLFDSAVGGAKSIGSNIKTTVSDMWGLAKAGDVEGIENYQSSEGDGPVAFASNTLTNIIGKPVFQTLGGLFSFGKNVKEVFTAAKDKVTDFGSDVKEYAATLAGYVDTDKDMADFSSEKMDGEDDNIAKSIIAPIIRSVMRRYVEVMRGINYLKDWAKDAIEDVKDDIDEKVDDVKEGAKNLKEGAVNTAKAAGSKVVSWGSAVWDTVNSWGTTAMNYVRGGSGDGEKLNGSSYYSQNDPRWKNAAYNMGYDNATMGDTGCGPTAMAMAASNVTGRAIDPRKMAMLSRVTGNRDATGTNWNFINQASSALGLRTQQAINPSAQYISSQLDSGNPVILSGQSGGYGKTPYTNSGHYVVAVGKDARGNVIVNDPRGRSYSGKYNLNDVANQTGSAWSFGGYGRRRRLRGGFGVEDQNNVSSGVMKWLSVVKAVKQAIAAQKVGYSQTRKIDITVDGRTDRVRTDCSGFVSACLRYFGVLDKGDLNSSMYASNTNQKLLGTGFVPRAWEGWEALQPGDIIARNGHVEIFAYNDGARHYVYNCGSHSSCNNPGETTDSRVYTHVWRPYGTGSGAISSYDVTGGSTYSSTGSNTSGGTTTNLWDRIKTGIGNFFNEFGSRALSGLLTGDWSNTDYSGIWGDSTGSTEASSDSVMTDSTGATTGTTTVNGPAVATPIPVSVGDMEKKIWSFFRSKGMSKAGIAGLMGNLRAESGLRTNNLQDSYEKKLGSDDEYTRKVDSNSYSNFVDDSAGYGLAQWTYSTRKAGLLNAAKAAGKSISDPDVQLNYLWNELNSNYKGVTSGLMSASDVQSASDLVLTQFEKPQVQDSNVKAKRAGYGLSYYQQLGGLGGYGDGPKISNTRRYRNAPSRRPNRGGFGNVDYNSISKIQSAISTNKYYNARTAQSYTSGVTGSSNTSDLLYKAIEILAIIAGNTGDASTKLDALNALKDGNGNQNNIFVGGNNSTNITHAAKDSTTLTVSHGDVTAQRIAKGGY